MITLATPTQLRTLLDQLKTLPESSVRDQAIARAQKHLDSLTSTADVVKVGPKGYEHGWIFVGVPSSGDVVHHPSYGSGHVIHHDGTTVTVRFHGEEHTFRHRAGTHSDNHFEQQDTRPESPKISYPTLSSEGMNDNIYDRAPDASHSKKLNPGERAALKNYGVMAFLAVNDSLRNGERTGDKPQVRRDTDTVIKGMDSAFSKMPRTTQPITVMRGVEAAQEMFGRPGSKVGKKFTDKGFVSTTTNAETSKGFAENGEGDLDKNSALLTIHVPPGSQAMSLGDLAVSPLEKEILLNRGSSFRVISDSTATGVRQIALELIPS